MTKLAIVVSHPIQYYAPLFRYLAARMDIVVLYAHNPTPEETGRQGFGQKITWDVDLLSGYPHIFLRNVARRPSLESFRGCHTPDIGNEIGRQGATHVVIFGWFLQTHWQAYWHCQRTGLPCAVRGDSQPNPHEGGWKKVLKARLYPLFIRRYTRLFYVGVRNRQYLTSYGASPQQLLFAPHAVDQDFWKKESAHQPTPPDGPIRLLWVGKFIAKKRPLEAIRAVRQCPDVTLDIVGTGPLQSEMEAAAAGSNQIRFLGFRNQTALRSLMAQADALLLTSDHGETWGLVVNEAFAMGLPAVVSDACGCAPDMIEEDATGYTYPSGDETALRMRLGQLAARLRQNPAHFAAGLAAKNAVYAYENIYAAFRTFTQTT